MQLLFLKQWKQQSINELLKDEMFPPFQINLAATPIEKVELLAKYLTNLFEKVQPQNRIEINKNNIQKP